MIKNLLEYINKGVTSFQVIENTEVILKQAGFLDFAQNDYQAKRGGKYYITKNDSSIIAFVIPDEIKNPAFHIVASHSDSPTFKVKPSSALDGNGYQKLNTESYGGAIYYTWMDRPVSLAGRIFLKSENGIKKQLVNLKEYTFIIPSLAIHLNRDANSGMKFNEQIDMSPIIGVNGTNLNEILQKEFKEEILDYDLFLYNKEVGTLAGANNELILAPRIDDLGCAYASLQAFLESKSTDNINMLAIFDNEEVGSKSLSGADSTFLTDTIEDIIKSCGWTDQKRMIINKSFMVSADNAHAIHPNKPEKSDPINNVKINQGIVIKYHASLSYTTDAYSGSIFKKICNKADIPYQNYTNRSDLRGGGTLGKLVLGHLSIPAIDIGLAQLAMHSSYETAGKADVLYMIQALKAFYQTKIEQGENGEIKIDC